MARILIVDDSPSQLLGIKRIVEKLGHETLSAEDGAAGVEVAKAEKPDLILMDVVMPNLNGFQATRTISKNADTAHIPIILVTTNPDATRSDLLVWVRNHGVPELAVPRRVIAVPEIPVLGSGKTDYPGVAKIVARHVETSPAQSAENA